MLSPDGAVVLLYRTYPESPSKPKDWVMDGWATRMMSSLFIGGEKLEVVGHWRPGLSEQPVHLGKWVRPWNTSFMVSVDLRGCSLIIRHQAGGRRGTEWITDPDGIAASWRIPSMGDFLPAFFR